MKSRRRRTTATRTTEDLGDDVFDQGKISRPPASDAFEFSTRRSKTLFGHLVKAFIDDYMKRRHPSDDSGWRGLGQLAKDMKTPPSSMYGRHGGMSPQLGELVRKGLVETRVFRGE